MFHSAKQNFSTTRLSAQKQAFQFVRLQLVSVLLLALVLSLFNLKNGISLLLGGLVYIMASSCFIIRFFPYQFIQNTKKTLAAFYISEVVKFLVMAGLVLIVLNFIPIEILSFLSGILSGSLVLLVIPFFQKPTLSYYSPEHKAHEH